MSVRSVNRGPRGRFKNTYELLNLRALKFQCCRKNISFNVSVRYFVWNFKGYLWNSTQNILPIHWNQWLNGLHPHDSTHSITKSSRKRIQLNWFSSANYNNQLHHSLKSVSGMTPSPVLCCRGACQFLEWLETLQWRHNGCDSVSNHQPHDCLPNRLFRGRSKKTLKLRVTGRGIPRGPVNSPHKWPVTRKPFPFDDVIINFRGLEISQYLTIRCSSVQSIEALATVVSRSIHMILSYRQGPQGELQ